MGRYVLSLVMMGFFLYTASTSLTQVQPGERAVIRRFGRILHEKPEQGLYVGWPWGVERVERVPIGRVRRITVGFGESQEKEEEVIPSGQLLTGDHNLVNVQAEIYFKVDEADVEKFVLYADQIDALVARTSESLLAEWIAGRKVDDVLLRGKIELPRFLRDRLQERLGRYELGLVIEQASITHMFPPEEVKEAFDQVAQAQTNVDTRLNQARQDAERQKSDLESKIYNIHRLALSYANEENLRAEADADSFRRRLEQYHMLSATNRDYLNTLWLDGMTRLYAKMREEGRIELLDHYLTGEGISITQFPLQPRKK